MYCLAGRSEGLQPYFGFVVSSALINSSRLVSQGGVVLGMDYVLLLSICMKKKLEVIKG
jgi:hypothetical protein